MSRKPRVAPIQLTKGELLWLHGFLSSATGPTGYFYRGATFRFNAASVRDKVHAHLWPDAEKQIRENGERAAPEAVTGAVQDGRK